MFKITDPGPITLGRAVEYYSVTIPKKVAVITANNIYCYEELYRESKKLADTLLKPVEGKRLFVFSFLPTGFEFAASFLATQIAGAIYIPLNINERLDILNDLYMQIQPELILISGTQKRKLDEIIQGSKLAKSETATLEVNGNREIVVQSKHAVIKGSKANKIQNIDPEQVCYLNMTSGTTGALKGALTSQKNIYWNSRSAVSQLGLCSDDIFLCTFPAYLHPHEQLARSVYLGATTVLVEFDIHNIWELLERSPVTWLNSSPPIFDVLLKFAKFKNKSLPHLRGAEAGGSIISEKLVRDFENHFQVRMIQVWGSTETTGIAVASPKSRKRFREGAIGRACPYYKVEIVDVENRDMVADGEIGEIRFRGPGVCQGYFSIDLDSNPFQDGWYYSGDLAYRDEDGLMVIVGREQDVIKQQGLKVYPSEVEAVLRSHQKIKDACVFGIIDPSRGESVVAALIVEKGRMMSVQEVMAHCNMRLASHKVPRFVLFVASFPQSNQGKIDRKQIAENTRLEGKL